MSRTADYLGLVAYMFVMYGGLPGRDHLWSDALELRPRRTRSKLKIVQSNDRAPARKRRQPAARVGREAAA